MVAPDESPGPHCLSPLAHSWCYYLSVDREAAEGLGERQQGALLGPVGPSASALG